MNMYTAERVTPHITRIKDIADVACYLIEGEEKACLLDTCCGYGDLKKFVQQLTDRNPFVILTHGHYDHTGSASLFEEVYMNHDDLPVLQAHNTDRGFYLEEDRKCIPSLRNITMNDLNPLYEKVPEPLHDGQIFDLGSIHIRMTKAKGHTPGMMCALVPEERVIFFGDACGMNVLLHDRFSSDVSEYLQTLVHLKQMENRYDLILRNHGTYTNDKNLLDNVIDCAQMILNHTDDHHPVQMYGKTLFEAKRRIDGKRADGLEGNIIYAAEKAR